MELDDEWESFLGNPHKETISVPTMTGPVPTPTTLYISTNTIISYLNEMIDLVPTFWGIPVLPYNCPQEGVIKKQMKFNSTSSEEVAHIQSQWLAPQFV